MSMAAGQQMARKMELRKLGSCFTLAAILIIATFSYQVSVAAAAAEEPETTISSQASMASSVASSTEWPSKPAVQAEATRRSLVDVKGIASWLLKILNSLRKRILDEILQILGLPPTGDIFWFLVNAVKFLYEKLKVFFSDPGKPYEIAMEWVVDSALNPFRTIKKGIKSFDVLFRFLHKLRKGTHAGFGLDNPIYACYLRNHPKCVVHAKAGVILDFIIYQFYCAWQFYEECTIHYWWKKGKWRAPNVNLEEDPCKSHPRGKCPDEPPKN